MRQVSHIKIPRPHPRLKTNPQEGTALLKQYRQSKLAKGVNLLWRLPETLIGRILVTLAFIPAYVAYVR